MRYHLLIIGFASLYMFSNFINKINKKFIEDVIVEKALGIALKTTAVSRKILFTKICLTLALQGEVIYASKGSSELASDQDLFLHELGLIAKLCCRKVWFWARRLNKFVIHIYDFSIPIIYLNLWLAWAVASGLDRAHTQWYFVLNMFDYNPSLVKASLASFMLSLVIFLESIYCMLANNISPTGYISTFLIGIILYNSHKQAIFQLLGGG
ncbi:hypothetical protein ACJX0J_019426, partial [Zea mays]